MSLQVPTRPALPGRRRPIFVVVEGKHDIEFMYRISRVLHQHDHRLPDLARLESEGRLIFIPTGGGGNLALWAQRLAVLQHPEFHLYDREVPPTTAERQELVETINRRPTCVARLTTRRSLENYLHPSAILDVGGMLVEFGADDDLPYLLARMILTTSGGPCWNQLSRRSSCRLRNRIKRWLNTAVVDRMTPELLADIDPRREVVSWLATIAKLVG